MPVKRVTNRQVGVRVNVSIGDRYGRLVVVEELPGTPRNRPDRKNAKRRSFLCRCDCGRETKVALDHLRSGHTASCECLQRDSISNRAIHGMSYSDEFSIWCGILKRCEGKDAKNYHLYSSVEVHEQWKSDFLAFYRHLGPRPTKRHSVDRIDGTKGYVPGNVRWATPKEQAWNRRVNIVIKVEGEKRLLVEVAESRGMNLETLRERINRGVPYELWFHKGRLPRSRKK